MECALSPVESKPAGRISVTVRRKGPPRGTTVVNAKSEQPRRIAVLGAPIDMGASQRGTLMGPAAIRTAGLLTLLESLGFAVTDHGDVSITGITDLADAAPDKANHYREIQRWTRALSR